jgi:hypothetical protein
MATQFAMVRKLGQTRRRACEVRHNRDTYLRLEALDMDFRQGF